jgi:hypothetical protein
MHFYCNFWKVVYVRAQVREFAEIAHKLHKCIPTHFLKGLP